MGSDGIREDGFRANLLFAQGLSQFTCGILTGSDGIRKASYRKIVLAPKASHTKRLSRGGIQGNPKRIDSSEFAFRRRLVAIHVRDPDGIPRDPKGELP